MSCPSTIEGFVIPFIVDAVDSQLGRNFAHIGKEGFKVVPAFADRDPSAAPIFEFGEIGVFTALDYSPPNVVGATWLESSRVAVRDILLIDELFTSAASRVSVSEISAGDDCFVAAIADAKPANVALLAVNADGDKKPEPFSSYVEEAHFG